MQRAKSLYYNPDDRLQYLISRRNPRHTQYTTAEWYNISKAYWENWSRSRSDQRTWIQMDEYLGNNQDQWRGPTDRLRIQTNFLGDRTIQRQQN